MKNLIERLQDLQEQSSSVEIRDTLSSIVEYGKYSSLPALYTLISEKLGAFASEHQEISDFLKKEKRWYWVHGGIVESFLNGIKTLSVLDQHTDLRYKLSYIKESVGPGSLSSLTQLSNITSILQPHSWIKEIRDQYEVLEKETTQFSAELELAHVLLNANRKAFGAVANNIFDLCEQFIYDGDRKFLDAVVRECEKLNAYASIREIQSILSRIVKQNHELVIESKDARTVEIKDLYSLTLFENNGFYFLAENRFWRVQGTKLIAIPDEKTLPGGYKELARFLHQDFVKMYESGIEIFADKHKVIIYKDAHGSIKSEIFGLDGTSTVVQENNFSRSFMPLASINPFLAQLTPILEKIVVEYDNILNIDSIKLIKSKVYEGVSILLHKKDSVLNLYKRNDAMNEHKVFENLGSLQAVNTVKEFMGVDISGSLSSMLEGDYAKIASFDTQMKEILETIEQFKERMTQIIDAQKDEEITEELSEQLSQLYEGLAEEVRTLENSYNDLTVKKKHISKVSEGQHGHYEVTPGYEISVDGKNASNYDMPPATQYGAFGPEEDKMNAPLLNGMRDKKEKFFYAGQTVKIVSKGFIGQIISIDYPNDTVRLSVPGQINFLVAKISDIKLLEL